MKTYNRICLENYTITDQEGTSFTLERNKEYLTSAELSNKEVMVFSTYWVRVPLSIFAGEKQFT